MKGDLKKLKYTDWFSKLGNEHESLMIGASRRKGNRNTLMDVATAQIASKGNENEKTDCQDEDEF